MVGFGTCKKQAVEDYGSYKENKHMQPRSAANPNTVDASLADPLHAAGKPNMRDYVDSMDTAFPAGARSHAQSEAPAKVEGKQGASITISSPILLRNEKVEHHFQTLAEFTFGLPRHELLCTNKRVIVRQRLRLMGLVGKTSEQTIQYRDIVEVKFGPFNKNLMTLLALVFVALGLLSFTILEAGGAKKSAALAISACFIWAASLIAYNILVDHFTEGVNIEILTIRAQPDGRNCARSSAGPIVKTQCVRLPETEAQDAIQFLMHHSGTSIWQEDEMV